MDICEQNGNVDDNSSRSSLQMDVPDYNNDQSQEDDVDVDTIMSPGNKTADIEAVKNLLSLSKSAVVSSPNIHQLQIAYIQNLQLQNAQNQSKSIDHLNISPKQKVIKTSSAPISVNENLAISTTEIPSLSKITLNGTSNRDEGIRQQLFQFVQHLKYIRGDDAIAHNSARHLVQSKIYDYYWILPSNKKMVMEGECGPKCLPSKAIITFNERLKCSWVCNHCRQRGKTLSDVLLHFWSEHRKNKQTILHDCDGSNISGNLLESYKALISSRVEENKPKFLIPEDQKHPAVTLTTSLPVSNNVLSKIKTESQGPIRKTLGKTRSVSPYNIARKVHRTSSAPKAEKNISNLTSSRSNSPKMSQATDECASSIQTGLTLSSVSPSSRFKSKCKSKYEEMTKHYNEKTKEDIKLSNYLTKSHKPLRVCSSAIPVSKSTTTTDWQIQSVSISQEFQSQKKLLSQSQVESNIQVQQFPQSLNPPNRNLITHQNLTAKDSGCYLIGDRNRNINSDSTSRTIRPSVQNYTVPRGDLVAGEEIQMVASSEEKQKQLLTSGNEITDNLNRVFTCLYEESITAILVRQDFDCKICGFKTQEKTEILNHMQQIRRNISQIF